MGDLFVFIFVTLLTALCFVGGISMVVLCIKVDKFFEKMFDRDLDN